MSCSWVFVPLRYQDWRIIHAPSPPANANAGEDAPKVIGLYF